MSLWISYLSTNTESMSNAISTLQPQALWKNFADLNAVPRASKKEERVIQFMVDYGKNLGLETMTDSIGNVIIKKPASAGMEHRQTIVMQSHLDMVHQKNSDMDFNFDTEGIKMLIEEDWVRADGTTLGADNGIGVATIMAVLAATDIEHPAIEALFTIDEETGMTGALGLKGGLLTGTILLNLDTEDDNELTIGCAGGVDLTAKGMFSEITVPSDHISYKVMIKGLSGGHSGMDIHKGLGNVNKLMNRFLLELSKDTNPMISTIDGGGLRNAIPRESYCILSIASPETVKLKSKVQEFQKILIAEYGTTDPDASIQLDTIDKVTTCGTPDLVMQFLRAVYACPNGIYRMSPDINDLVQTSNNVARVKLDQGRYQVLCLTRSSVDSEKQDLENAIRSTFQLIGAEVETSGSYPGWTPKPSAPIIQLMSNIYQNMFKEKPQVNACHAGLECGIIGTNYPDMDMISFGPNIRGAHSPDEKVQISSVQKYWKYLMEVLKNIPEK